VLSAIGGFVGMPMQAGGHLFERWLAPVFAGGEHAAAHEAHLPAAVEWTLMAVSVLVAAFGIAMALRAYLQQPGIATRLRERFPGVHRLLLDKYRVDELYDALVVRPIHALARRLWTFWDVKVVDGTVNGVGYVFEGASALLGLLQTGFVGTYALFFTLGVVALLLHFLRHG
jgi:NADH-quinone oxidoreductase subunit L